jgi:hypothetical protein
MWRRGDKEFLEAEVPLSTSVIGINQNNHLITAEEFAGLTQDDDWKEELLNG